MPDVYYNIGYNTVFIIIALIALRAVFKIVRNYAEIKKLKENEKDDKN